MKITFLAPPVILGAFLALSGCGGAAEQPAPTKGSKELTITGGTLVLPAVAGNPGAAYFTLTNGTTQPFSLAAVSVDGGGKAEMHETSGTAMAPITTLTAGPGASVTFERGGKHVMVFDLRRSLKPGDTSKITLTFSGGKSVSAPLMVQSAAGDMGGMAH